MREHILRKLAPSADLRMRSVAAAKRNVSVRPSHLEPMGFAGADGQCRLTLGVI